MKVKARLETWDGDAGDVAESLISEIVIREGDCPVFQIAQALSHVIRSMDYSSERIVEELINLQEPEVPLVGILRDRIERLEEGHRRILACFGPFQKSNIRKVSSDLLKQHAREALGDPAKPVANARGSEGESR